MTGPTTRQLDDGSTVYSGTVAAGLIARETGFKEGESLRVLPFGYVAHDEADDPAAPLRTAVTVGADGVVREIAVTWGSGASRWSFRVTYSGLGTTPAPTAPANAEPLRRALRDEGSDRDRQPAPRADERCLSGRDRARKGCPAGLRRSLGPADSGVDTPSDLLFLDPAGRRAYPEIARRCRAQPMIT
jgi:hypothetical protein